MFTSPSNQVAAQPTVQAAPVLLVTNSSYTANPFGPYLGEIMRAEGLNEYDQVDLSTLSSVLLAKYPVVILAETTLTTQQAGTLTDYETGGGNLIAMSPDSKIAPLFGLGALAASSPQNDGYLKIDPTIIIAGETPGMGLANDTLQIHGPVNLYSTATSALVVAQLLSSANTSTPYPAVVYLAVGSGQGVAFTYDLARSIVYTRQGNPANAGIDIDNDGVSRTVDLFQKTGGVAGWVDLAKIAIPQADLQQRFFARLVKELANRTEPLPQLWYFPDNAMSMLIMTGDAHANPYQSPDDYYQVEIDSLKQHLGQMTMGLSVGAGPTCSQLQSWTSQGNTFSLHPYAYHPDPDPDYFVHNLIEGFLVANKWFQINFNTSNCQIPLSKVVRTHQSAWDGWTNAADDEASNNFSMDTSFYTWGQWLQNTDGSWAHGYINGSGEAMKFVHSDGTIVPVYQQGTQLVDEQLIQGTDSSLEGLNSTQALAVSKKLFDNSLQGGYSALTTQNDIDFYRGDAQVWAEATMDYATSKAVPIWNADRWLNFVSNRHDATYSNLTWNKSSTTLEFDLSSSINHLTTLLPFKSGSDNLFSVTVDGSSVSFTPTTVQDISVALITVSAGLHHFIVTYQSCTGFGSGFAGLKLTSSYQATDLIAGNQLSISLVAQNNGPSQAVNTTVVDQLPVEVSFISALAESQWSCVYSSNANIVTCNYSNLFGLSTPSTIIINIKTPETPGRIINKANITTDSCFIPSNDMTSTLDLNMLFGQYLPIIHQ